VGILERLKDILTMDVYHSEDSPMRVARWGNSLAVRLPVAVVEALQLKEGEEIEISVTGSRSLQVGRTQDLDRLLQKLRKYRGQLPADFRFDRLEANARLPVRKSGR
jgi:antitoxin MazE